MKNLITKFLVIVLLFLAYTPLFGQAGVGKISGKVTDEATGEPLIGANIVLVNTNLGAATGVDGNYVILNVSPGTYEVRASYIGYANKTIKEVRVVAGVTYDLNIQLTTDFTLPEVVVQERKFFEEKSTNTTKVIDAEEINRLPVKGVEQLASLQAGVVISEGSGGAEGNAEINVRGGRGNEVLYIVDGVPQNDVYSGSNYSQLSNSAIEQLSFQIGGYEAKYGQAQSGIISVTTKTGDPTYSVFGDVVTSSFTDNYGYNLYTMNLSGPIIPGNSNHTFFASAERGWFLDADPHSVGVSFNSDVVRSQDHLDNNGSNVWRYTFRTNHNIGDFQVKLGANINERNYRGYVHAYQKSNSIHNPRIERNNTSLSARISQNFSASSFWNLNLGYRIFDEVQGDGVWFDDLYSYGSAKANFDKLGVVLPNGNGSVVTTDQYGIFNSFGRVNNFYGKTNNNTMSADLDFTSQVENHLLEIGGGAQYNILRVYQIGPVGLAADNLANVPEDEKFRRMQPTAFGYDITGKNTTAIGSGEFEPKTPFLAYGYVQDRFELSDIVLNLGVRFDYFDTKADIIKNPILPYAYGDPNAYDAADFVKKKAEFYISPRIGLGFPITATTVFHAQYGKFIQQPPLNNLYTTIYDLNFLVTDNNWNLNTGHIKSEVTTQYEVGFRQVISNMAAINITAFYKNTEGLLNSAVVFFQRQEGGQTLKYITPTNTDFGTIKGMSLALDISRVSYFSLAVDYTYSIAEGTGSSTSSSFVAAFRNTNGEIPKVIAPLDFDQRHTGVINLDFYVPKDNLGLLELTNANILVSFASGRPYTPVSDQNLIAGYTNYGETKGYVNSVYGPGNFRVDFKLEKSFAFSNLFITPYVWVENLFDADNPVNVYRSTGSPYTTGFLSTIEGKTWSEGKRADYESFEKTPFNFGIPRLIRLGLKINFTNIQL